MSEIMSCKLKNYLPLPYIHRNKLLQTRGSNGFAVKNGALGLLKGNEFIKMFLKLN